MKFLFMALMVLLTANFASASYKEEVAQLKAQKAQQQEEQKAQAAQEALPYLCAKTGLANMARNIGEDIRDITELTYLLNPKTDAARIQSLKNEQQNLWNQFNVIRLCSVSYREAYRDIMQEAGVFVGTSELGRCTKTKVTCEGQKITLSRQLIKQYWKK